ncbi:MAG: hypothetical protein Q9163_003300 [Psora crenata]
MPSTIPVNEKTSVNGIEGAEDATQDKKSPSYHKYQGRSFETSIPQQPITVKHRPFLGSPGSALENPGAARANVAASQEKPNGTTEDDYAARHQHQTVVQQHAEYFDTDRDGVIWPEDTYVGFRKWGWTPILALLATLIIHVNLSYPTLKSWLPDPFFRIYVGQMYKNKHGSDSMSYDNEGRFRPQQFEDIFAKYDKGDKGGLDKRDLLRMWNNQRLVFDFWGWSAAALECRRPPSYNSGLRPMLMDILGLATYLLLWPDDGILRKEDIRGVFDVSKYLANFLEHSQQTTPLPREYPYQTCTTGQSVPIIEC